MRKCKSLARTIKTQRAPSWPCAPTPDLPSKDLADKLVDNYLQTLESVYRVIHVPSFRKDYDAIWTGRPPTQTAGGINANAAFLVQLKLILALGAVVHDDVFSLRPLAIRWVYEAQTYVAEPLVFKARLTIPALQTRILLLLARELIDVDAGAVWVEVGSILRTAMLMGLHRDPARLPRLPRAQAEMRRRLWGTVVELSVQASLYLGGPPLVSEVDFDCEMPGNFHDEEMGTIGGGEEAREQGGDDVFTGMTIPRAWGATLHVRLRVVKFLNDLPQRHGGGGSYAETLALDAQLRTAFKTMRQTLQRCSSNNNNNDNSTVASSFALEAVEFLAQRYTSALHAPYLGASFHERTCAFSRKVMLDTTLKMWCAAYPSSAIINDQQQISFSSPSKGLLFSRFILCSAGFFHTSAAQATFVLPAELRAQLQEDGYEGALLRKDVLAAVEEGKAWSLRCVEAGGTNAKGHMTPCLLAAHVDGLKRGLGGDEEALGRFLCKEAEEALDRALVVLEEMAAKTRPEGALEGEGEGEGLWGEDGDGMTLDDGLGVMMTENWDFTVSPFPQLLTLISLLTTVLQMSDAMLVSDDQGALAWAFGNGSTQKVSFW